jgi:mRNA-degrading endonuclease RelE of RelBE toxin-antitoxin system
MNCYNIDIHKSFDINIEKLKERYGDKFSSEMAINRNLDAERQILEKK